MMTNSIEIAKITARGDTIEYRLLDRTNVGGGYLLKKENVTAWIKFHHAESFNFSPEGLPESILALPVTLYLLPATYFYGVDLSVPSMDKTLYENLPAIYAAYSKIYGPFKQEWRGKVTVENVVENRMPESRYANIVFFSGGVDAVHAGVNNPGKNNVLVSVPSIEGTFNMKNVVGREFISGKAQVTRDFSAVSGSGWLLITNNFLTDVFDDIRIWHDLKQTFALTSTAFRFDGWFGIKYLGNLLSAAPFAYAMGIHRLIMGSAFEQIEDKPAFNLDGANPELSDAFKFSGVSFAEQDGLYTRRSLKVKNIVEWCKANNKKTTLRVCFDDSTEQCGKCPKCMRTQLNLLCAGENPKEWGFGKFDEKRFSRLVRMYGYKDGACWLWDIVESIDGSRTYPYCDKMLHWLKKTGYKRYCRRSRRFFNLRRALNISRYPHYAKVIFTKFKAR